LPDQVVIDRRILAIPPQTPPGVYQIEVGVYNPLTGQRLAVANDEADRILIADIRVMVD
jgi:hypothetical protein